MLHQHLTVAFRALDRKWGEPVDLDSSSIEDSLSYPCLPAVIEKPVTTFSSEEYLKTIRRRPKPYSRPEPPKKRSKMKDSFSNISMSRYQSSSDLGGSVSCLESRNQSSSELMQPTLMEELALMVADLKKPIEESFEETTSEEREAALDRRKTTIDATFKRLKEKAFSYVEEKYNNSLNKK